MIRSLGHAAGGAGGRADLPRMSLKGTHAHPTPERRRRCGANREGRRRGKTTNTTMTYCVWWMQAALLEELYESATSEDVTLTALIWDRVDHLPEVADGVRRKDGVSLSEAVAATAEQDRLSDN